MKKLFLLVLTVFTTLVIVAQPPLKREEMGPTRPLPNQFRDFVEHQQRWNNPERPTVVHKDGKVIITMSEQQFRRMQMIRRQQKMRMASFKQPENCPNCQMNHIRPHRGPIHNKF